MTYSIRIFGGILIAVLAALVLCCYMKRTYETQEVAGRYQGVFPCGDCPGIETTLTLYSNQTYTLVSDYRDRNGTFTTKGVWVIRWLAPVVELSNSEEQFYIIDKDTLELLGRDGERIQSRFNYKIQRTGEESVRASDASSI